MPGPTLVLLTRLDALSDAINRRDWDEVQFQYDRVRSTAERIAGTRDREVDRLRRDH